MLGAEMRRGLVFNIQKYSVQDGPGIRTTVFLKGCPLRCVWCHNPEGIAAEREIVVLETRCIACAECRRACRLTDEQPGEGPLPASPASCDLCGRCVEACPTQARQIIGKEMTVDQVLRVVLEDRLFYEESGGGVTFSGGEPLLQADFLRQALAACKDHGLKTAVDTCGLAAWEQLASVVPLADLFLFDVKFASDAKHRQYTGVSNQLILSNLRRLAQVHASIWIRVPLIPGLNDDPAELEAIAGLAGSFPSVRQVNLLPFHRTGMAKARRLGRDPLLAELSAPTQDGLSAALAPFQQRGLLVKIGG